MANFESSVKVIPYSQERVYAKLSDLSNLESVKDRLPEDKIQDLSFDSDTLSFSVSPIGQLTLQIVERDPCKCIKLATTNSPLPFNMCFATTDGTIVPLRRQGCVTSNGKVVPLLWHWRDLFK